MKTYSFLTLTILLLSSRVAYSNDNCMGVFAESHHRLVRHMEGRDHSAQIDAIDSKLEYFPNLYPDLNLFPRNDNHYTQERSLLERSDDTQSYERTLPDGFKGAVLSLNRNDIWLDSGAGAMVAIYDYLQVLKGLAKVIAIAPEVSKDTRYISELMTQQRHSNFFPIFGKLTEEVTEVRKGTVSLISDSFGAMAYTVRPDLVMKSYLNWLKVGGEIYATIGKDSRIGQFEVVKRRSFFGLGKELETTEWVEGNFINFLNRIQGIQYKATWTRGDFKDAIFKFVITKTSDQIKVPELKTIQYNNGYPPFRRFSFTKKYLK